MDYDYDNADRDARKWAMWCHLAALVALLGLPFGNILGPFFVWLMKRDSHPFVDQHGREAVNFQISMTLYFMVALLLCVILIGIVFVVLLPIGGLILTIIAAVKANDGEDYQYPFTIRLID